MKYFAGVGSRKVIQHAPELEPILKAITQCLNDQGYTLRSGGAEGCDKWFEAGARDDMKEIFYAGDATEESLKIASEIHPAWHRCSEWAQNLHGRNVFQVLGKDLQTPVDFLICWTQYGKDQGGTRTAIMLAKQRNIPVLNFGRIDKHKEAFEAFMLCQGLDVDLAKYL